jgi:predicted membrane protein
MSGRNILTADLSEPLDGATTAQVDIRAGDGNLTIGRLTGGEPLLASGTLQYLEKQGPPTPNLTVCDGQATLTLHSGKAVRPWFNLPWAACNGATLWQIRLNPAVSSEITAHSGGGNVRLDLAGMAITGVSADTGGGNIDVVLPENAANLSVTAKTGAGNVTVEVGNAITGHHTVDARSGAGNVVVRVPGGLAARVRATSGLGKVLVDARFSQIEAHTYQSPDYEGAAHAVEIVVHSGAGNVTVSTR